MKHILITTIFIFLLSQSNIADNILKDTIHHSCVLTIKSDSSSSPYKDFIPWIVALLLGISTLVLTNRQIRLSKESIDKQINTSKEIAQLELNKSVKSVNRQQWINSLRDCISEYLSLIETYKSNYENAKILNELVGFTKNITSASEIKKLGIKIELLLNPEEEKSIHFLNLFFEMSSFILDKSTDFQNEEHKTKYFNLKVRLLDITKSILKEEWERVKKGE